MRYDRFGEPLDDDLEDVMTARRFTQPIRHADDHDDAHAEVDRRRDELKAVRKLARERTAGACDVANAEYRLHLALQRVDSDGWTPPSIPSIADDEPAA